MSDENIGSSEDEAIGILADRYRLLNQLGIGAMGEVFLAEDTRLQRTVAVKSVLPKWCENSAIQRRIKRECLMHAKIGAHQNIVTLYDVIEEGTSLHLIMEYVEGETLQERMDRQVPVGTDLFVKQRINIVIQCLSALAHTHNQGIIHRDIKPANLILVPNESGSSTVKVTDFGIARLEEGSPEWSSLTNAGDQTPGTPLFMAPEQIDTAKYGKLSPATDIYATGVMLYYLLSGRPPFEGTLTNIFNGHLNTMPKPVHLSTGQAVHPRLSKAIEKAMNKEPADRFPSARAFEEELRAILTSNEPLVATEEKPSRGLLMSGLSSVKNRPRLLVGALAGAVVILAAAFLFGRGSTVTDEPRHRVENTLNPVDSGQTPEVGTPVSTEEPSVVQLDDSVPTLEPENAPSEEINKTMLPPGPIVVSNELVEAPFLAHLLAPDFFMEPSAVVAAADIEPMLFEDAVGAPTETGVEPAPEPEPAPETPEEAPVEEKPDSVEPKPDTYVVQPGDTLAEIAERFKLDTIQLARWNLMEDPNALYAGQKLYLYERPNLPPMKIKPKSPPKPQPAEEIESEEKPERRFAPIRAIKNVFRKKENRK